MSGARFLDLFAGSGAVGLEAMSRGCRTVTMVESEPTSLRSLARNARLAPTPIRVVRLPANRALALLAREGAEFDLLFADPPYDLQLGRSEGDAIGQVSARTALLAYEHAARQDSLDLGGSWLEIDARRYGDTGLTIFESRGVEAAAD